MVVRVMVRIINEELGKSKVLKVLVNGGAESEEPVIAVDEATAKELELSLSDMDVIEVELASGATHNYISRKKLLIELLDENGKTLSSTYGYVAVDPYLIEPLITDATIDELGIQVISFKKGLWRHVSDSPNKIRLTA